VEIKIVRHDRGAQNADGDVQHFPVAQDFRARDKANGGLAPKGMREKYFVSETGGD
jgi:hypothetical protein